MKQFLYLIALTFVLNACGKKDKKSENNTTDSKETTSSSNKDMVSLEGTWEITSSKTLEGQSYKGTVDISKEGDCHKIKWNLEGSTPYEGVAIQDGNNLYVGWGLGSLGYGLVVYKINDDGTLDGQWTDFTAKGAKGTEKATGGKGSTVNGTYQVEGSNPGNSQKYKGTVSITQTGKTYDVAWSTGGPDFKGVGIQVDDKLVVGWGLDKAFGVVSYTFDENTAKGIWSVGSADALGSENLKKN